MAYLNELHPELFFVIPRPGGIANIELPEVTPQFLLDMEKGSKSSKSTMRSRSSLRSSRSRRSKSVVDATSIRLPRLPHPQRDADGAVGAVFGPGGERRGTTRRPDPIQDTVDLLAATLSAVMMMAAGKGHQIPRDHLRWALSFLENVKDELIDDKLVSYNDNGEGEAVDGSAGDVAVEPEIDAAEEPPAKEGGAEDAAAEEEE
nr:unnamed protein product [Callosobruchus chinensis]